MLALMSILEEAGVPPGVVNLVPSRASGSVVAAMLADQRIRVISFTGSTEVGRTLLKQAAENVVRPAMELGGNAPFIVFEDADIEDAVARSEEHTSELQSLMRISYAVFCLKKKKHKQHTNNRTS